MTTPGGHGNEINLAALWVPVMPETSHMGEEMKKAGAESKRKFEEGFNTGSSPESMGSSFGSKLNDSLSKEFKNFELPFGASGFLDKFSRDIDEKLVRKLSGSATQALSTYRQEWENLTAAQARAAEAEQKINTARDGGFNKASIMIPLIREQTQAQTALTEATTRTGAAHDDYNSKLGRLSEETSNAGRGSQILAGIMGGAVVAGANLAVSAVENLVEGIAEGFEKAIEISTELAKTAVELGETYEHIGIQVTEFSSATGDKFEELEAHAQAVFGQLDVAGNDVGKTMAQFAAILDAEPSPALDTLVRHVTDLQGRFTTLKGTDLAAIFHTFKVPVEEADSALASLLKSARDSGQDLGQLASGLSGNVAITLAEAGLNLQQAGAFMGDLLKMGAPGRQAMTGMTMAMKDFGSVGLSFSDGMKMAGQKLKELGDTAEGQDFAEKLFGTRNWIVAKDAVRDYLDIVNQGPEAFNANSASVDGFISDTETLDNKLETFKHNAEETFKPFGDAAKNAAIQGLGAISNWFSLHHTEIIGDIKHWGDEFIGMLPEIQEFTGIGLRLIGDFAAGALVAMVPLANQLGLAGAGVLALTGHFKEAGDLLGAVGKMDVAALTGKIAFAANDMADKIEGMDIHSQSIRDSWDGIADAAMRVPPTVSTGAGQTPFDTTGPGSSGPAAAAGFPTPVGAGAPAGSPTGGSGPLGALTPSGGGGGVESNRSLAQQLFTQYFPMSEWSAFDQLEMKEAGYSATAENASGAYGMGQFMPYTWPKYGPKTADPTTQLQYMFQYIKDRYGTPSAAWAQYYQHKGGEGSYATGGWVGEPGVIDSTNPIQPRDYSSLEEYLEAINLASFLGSTMQGHALGGFITGNVTPHVPGHNRGGSDPGLACAEEPCVFPWELGPGSAAPPAKHRIPGLPYPGDPGWTPGKVGYHATGGPSGTDTVPAWLTPGEYVWDTGTVDKYGWLISMLHKGKGFQGGGPADGGKGAGVDSQLQFIAKIAEGFGLQLTSGKSGPGNHSVDGGYHDSGEAADFSNGDKTDAELAFATYMVEHFGSQLSELIHDDPRWTSNIHDGKPAGAMDSPGGVYTTAQAGYHGNHVHVAIKASQAMSDLSPGNEMLSAGLPPMPSGSGPGSTSGPTASGPNNYPGVANQYGGLGYYGGMTADQDYQTSHAVQEAKDRAADMDRQIKDQQKRIADLRDQIAHVADPTKTDPAFGLPVKLTPDELAAADKKRTQLQDQLNSATEDLDRSTRDRTQQNDTISEAERKREEAMYKLPESKKVAKPTGMEAFSQLGSGLLGGIGQELGFGDLFAKPPWEWGAIKLLTGAASWAMGTANAWADEIGKGHTGLTNQQPVPGWDQQGGVLSGLLGGAAGSLGVDLPKLTTPAGPNVSAGPNVVQGQPGPGYGQPVGPAPGPPTVNNDNSIHVQAGVDPGQILPPVQELANSANSRSFTHGP